MVGKKKVQSGVSISGNRGKIITTEEHAWLVSEYNKYKNTSYGTIHTKKDWYIFMAQKFKVHPRTIMYHVEKKINESQKEYGRQKRTSTIKQNQLRDKRIKRFTKKGGGLK